MRLPQVRYNRQVQTLGRPDIAGPGRVARARMQAIGAAAKAIGDVALTAATAVEAEEMVKVAAAANQFNTAMKRSEAELTTSHSIDLNTIELPPGVDAKLQKYQEDPQGRRLAPVEEVADLIHQARAREYRKHYAGDIKGGRASEAFEKAISNTLTTTSTNVFKYGTAQKLKRLEADYDLAFDEAKRTGDAENAMRIAETAYRTGVWAPEKYAKSVDNLPGDVTFAKGLQMLETDDPVQVQYVIDNAFANNPMSLEQKTTLFTKAMQRRDQIEDDIEKAEAKRREEIGVSVYESWSQGLITAEQARRAAQAADPQWRRVIMAETRESTASSFFSSAVRDQLQAKINELSISMDPDADAALIQEELLQRQEDGQLRGEDVKALQAQLQAWREGPFNTEGYKTALHMLQTDILNVAPGGTLLTEMGDDKIAAMEIYHEALTDLRNYVQFSGPRADPVAWWGSKRDYYSRQEWIKRQFTRSGLDIPLNKYGEPDITGFVKETNQAWDDGAIDRGVVEDRFYQLRKLMRKMGIPETEYDFAAR